MKPLYLDDIRWPPKGRDWKIVRDVAEAVEYCQENGCPRMVSFDHDLGDGIPTGFDFAKWLCEMDMDCGGKFIPTDFEFFVHSANPVGKANIEGYLSGYLSQR
jgi:hypothetical protein